MRSGYFWGILSLFLFSCSVKVEQEKSDYYNLTLSDSRLVDGLRWTAKLTDDTLRWRLRKELDPDLNSFVCCLTENRLSDGKRLRLSTVLGQQFPLYRKFRKAEIEVNIKEENLQEAWLKVFSLDLNEKCVRRDSVKVNGKKWHKYRLDIPLEHISYLWLSFHVEGKPCQTHNEAKMLIYGLDIRLDGQSVNIIDLPDRVDRENLDTTAVLPLSFSADSLVGDIGLWRKSPKVIGLGETMHGTYSFGVIRNQLIRWLVEKKECKLVMVELPAMLVLKWDLYAQGYPVDLEEILEDLTGTTKCRDEVTDLLLFLREYNTQASRKVHVAGIDRSPGMEYFPFVHDYFYEKYAYKRDKIAYDWLKTDFLPDSLLPLMAGEKITGHWGDFEYDWFKQLYWLKMMENHIPGVKEKGALYFRDYIMWRHVYYALKAVNLQENECAVVTGHWLHLNKGGFYNSYTVKIG